MLDADAFESLRRYLFAIAYRMLGSASEAEDIVQDAYLRARDVRADEVHSLKAYLATVVTRLCLDQLRSARAQREVYIGPWLPEPVPTADLTQAGDVTNRPAEATEQADDISLALLVLLERLTPEERATYVLREAFAYPYDEIASVLGKSSAAVRQLSHRAKKRVAAGRPRFQTSPETQRALAERFLAASRGGDLGALTAILAADVTGWSDGGGVVRAARRPIVGRDAVARLIVGQASKWLHDVTTTFASVNGGIAALYWRDGHLINVLILDADASGIHAILAVVNPEKLAYLERRLGEMPGAM
ncbi:MAG: RNA polymerase sigma-70 factor [Propionibacteriaceae bacterium]|nr:RNA polymerase sigma-70 factor [Propionibacteriaceae bacterium]